MSRVASRREQYSQATRAALLAAATRRFAAQGFAGTSLEDVAADIQATRGAIYHHFANKTALFEAVFDQLETDALDESTAAAERAGDPAEAAYNALDAFLERCCDPVYGRLVWQEGPIALGWPQWLGTEKMLAYGFIERLMDELMESGHLERQPLPTTTRLVFGMLTAAAMTLANAAEETKPQLKTEYLDMISRLLGALRAEPGTT
ncbi:TetR/AcrR family transcriptional regulator [Kibdelosporangium phytohabitans]|uniref:TetR family transcriptional regulator n=1 Tax=Kibdelosporangium phytohabitans TaxID=860235 RepID=A0A0N9HPH0_9PSEU|nr:TetR/AcrR family transcriptional regulator [Kibdelosporangium phytohabitans]ALG08885.1 TetR family transcriptional regulator [Kibdelosporangium phytohabitans]MBE1469962.1 AcrR family transcriptional regulator [Kibdelosporangium phytohabitans]